MDNSYDLALDLMFFNVGMFDCALMNYTESRLTKTKLFEYNLKLKFFFKVILSWNYMYPYCCIFRHQSKTHTWFLGIALN